MSTKTLLCFMTQLLAPNKVL